MMGKGGLRLIGIGPGNLDLMTKQAIEMCQTSDVRFLEGYTSTLPKDSENILENIVGNWSRLMRPMMEEANEILELAKQKIVAIMIVGDPMMATTHIDIRLRCMELGISFLYVPGISAISLAISTSGLQSYRFGRQVTITYQYGDYLPTSPLTQIIENKSRGLHTLALLDLDPTGMGIEAPVHMTPQAAGETLLAMFEKCGGAEEIENIRNWDVLVCSDLGTFSERIIGTTIEGLNDVVEGRIHCLIIPANMHDMEKISFDYWKNHS